MKSLNVGSTKMGRGVACGLQVSTRVVCSGIVPERS